MAKTDPMPSTVGVFVEFPEVYTSVDHPGVTLAIADELTGLTAPLERGEAELLVAPRLGAHDKPVLFLHPKDFLGTLVELEQA